MYETNKDLPHLAAQAKTSTRPPEAFSAAVALDATLWDLIEAIGEHGPDSLQLRLARALLVTAYGRLIESVGATPLLKRGARRCHAVWGSMALEREPGGARPPDPRTLTKTSSRTRTDAKTPWRGPHRGTANPTEERISNNVDIRCRRARRKKQFPGFPAARLSLSAAHVRGVDGADQSARRR